VSSAVFGAKVACAELPFAFVSGEQAGGLGGTSVLRGCVPKKLFMYCGEYAELMKDAAGFGCVAALPGCGVVPDSLVFGAPRTSGIAVQETSLLQWRCCDLCCTACFVQCALLRHTRTFTWELLLPSSGPAGFGGC
jgi:hypothetical protein